MKWKKLKKYWNVFTWSFLLAQNPEIGRSDQTSLLITTAAILATFLLLFSKEINLFYVNCIEMQSRWQAHPDDCMPTWKKVLVFSPIQSVPLQHVITDAGNPLYQIATQIYKQKLQYTITQIAVKCKNCGMQLRFYFIVIWIFRD